MEHLQPTKSERKKRHQTERLFKDSISNDLNRRGIVHVREFTMANGYRHTGYWNKRWSMIADFCWHGALPWAMECKPKFDAHALAEGLGQAMLYKRFGKVKLVLLCFPSWEVNEDCSFYKEAIKACSEFGVILCTEDTMLDHMADLMPLHERVAPAISQAA